MSYETLLYKSEGPIATVTLNLPKKFNTIRPPMPDEIAAAMEKASKDPEVRVIVLQGAGSTFCAGFDFSGNLEQYDELGVSLKPEDYDPGRDVMAMTSPFTGPVPKFMSIWRNPKPVICKIHGWCVGGGSEMALCADIVVAADDARLGTPYARVWGCHLTGMWIYRLGLTRAKQYALTGDSISGQEAAEIGLINDSCPAEELDQRVAEWAGRMAKIPTTQLMAMKLVVNQAYENMGLQTTQYMGPILDGIMRNTPEGRGFVDTAFEHGVQGAVAERDGPFGDYSQGGPEMKPRRRSNV
ncbi:MAG: crotonase/enoyl-CoA hydratase family protein [Alphaproteobacteria bacterium]|jgi:enoyl-CoA hydratase|nr:enoyl-CoA hydratase [Rhodospirillaceae bacterium]MDP6403680.1 crotonase/enoyl-CoA hydratase family protein [Alphaproteobacteria bacterium]MDP6622516.1 crotonase/enoyl-CoA hydratase family protein [Alphaproteobacteria bacterium]MDP7605186.1 crotonase/enoyl-CoA hydratase family protein [Alphaproteobacteria bacterium]HJP20035.1 crotonase/enoyl-CoA hydratase family protein [Alphaproteobacteria bacterium]